MTISFARHQFPPAIIRHAVWVYVRLTLSYRDVEDLLAERGLDVSCETVRRWVLRFGPLFARELRRRRPRPTSRWHLDEMALMIAGTQFWLWRAVDDEGEVLDLLVQRRRDKAAAVKLMRKLLKKQGFAPDVLVTDKLRSYGAAKAELGLSARHEQGLRTGLAQEQSRREFASTNTAAGSQDAALQIAGISPTLSIHSGRRQPRPVRTCGARAFPQTTRRRRWSSVTGVAVWTAATAARGKHGTGSQDTGKNVAIMRGGEVFRDDKGRGLP